MGSGTDVATETANVILLGDNLLEFVTALTIARRVHQVILVNFVGTLLIDGLSRPGVRGLLPVAPVPNGLRLRESASVWETYRRDRGALALSTITVPSDFVIFLTNTKVEPGILEANATTLI